MPYPNLGMCSDGDGSAKVKVKSKNALRKGDTLSKSNGDNAGTAGGGVKSNKFMGKVELKMGSPQVKVEGKQWAHHGVPCAQNDGNTVGIQSAPCQGAVSVIGAGTDDGNAATAGGAAADGGAAGGGAGGANGENNKPCACPKSTSPENRDKVNEKDPNGDPPKCPVCEKTGGQVQQEYMAKWQAQLTGAAAQDLQGPAQIAAKKLDWWSDPRRSRLQSDHVYPASVIKKRKDFQALERTNLEGARKVMTAQSNMRGLCMICNGKKGAKVKRYLGIEDQTFWDKASKIGQLIKSGGS